MSTPVSPRTNLGPLMTTFTAPSSCYVMDISFSRATDQIHGSSGKRCQAKGDVQAFFLDEACYPGELGAYINSGNMWLTTRPIYSPGLVCPAGYKPTCSVVKSNGVQPPATTKLLETADREMWDMLNLGETAVGCCPSGYGCDSSDILKCITMGKPGDAITAIYRADSCKPTAMTVTISKSFTDPVATAQRIIMIQGMGIASLSGVVGATHSSAAPSSTSETIPGATGERGASEPAPGGLSTGAKIAVGIVVPTLMLLAIGGLVFFLRQKRRKSGPVAGTAPSPAEYSQGTDRQMKPEQPESHGMVPTTPYGQPYNRAELGCESKEATACASRASTDDGGLPALQADQHFDIAELGSVSEQKAAELPVPTDEVPELVVSSKHVRRQVGFKSFFTSKTKVGSASASSTSKANPFLQPRLAPGMYGQFPQTFSLYFLGRSPGKETDTFLLVGGESLRGQPRPLNAITVHKGMVKVQVVLHAGPTRDSPPIGLAGTEKLFRSASVLALPSQATAGGGNQIVELVDNGGLKFENWAFNVPVACATEKERFEWRSSDLWGPQMERPFQRRLVRVSTSVEGHEDVLMRWTDELAPEQESRLGTVRFEGVDLTGVLGSFWTLAAVMSLLRIVQVKSEAQVAADGMLQAAGRLAGLGLGLL